MEWVQFKDKWPDEYRAILYYEASGDYNIAFVHHGTNKEIKSNGYFCNDRTCRWTPDDCGCCIVVHPDDYWMYVPDEPQANNNTQKDQ